VWPLRSSRQRNDQETTQSVTRAVELIVGASLGRGRRDGRSDRLRESSAVLGRLDNRFEWQIADFESGNNVLL
jgi:hypothetical protein